MRRATMFCLFGGLSAMLGMSGETCDPNLDPASVNFRGDPSIIATSPREDASARTFEVDLRRYPDTATLTWEFGDGAMLHDLSVAKGRRVSHDYHSSDTFTVKVYLFSYPDIVKNTPARHLATGSLPVDVLGTNQSPTAAFTIEEVAATDDVVGITRKFIGSRSRDPDGEIVEYRWDFGDGGQAIGRTVEHTYTESGRFIVRLSVKDDRGERAFTERSIFVNVPPKAIIRSEVDANNGLLVHLSGADSNDPDGAIARYDWDFGDGETANDGGAIVNHTYAAPGTFTVRLIVFDSVGITGSAQVNVTVSTDDLIVTSVGSRYGEVGTQVSGLMIDGANFTDGITARLERQLNSIAASSVTIDTENRITVGFDLSGAPLGDYDVVVQNPNSAPARLEGAFRVVSPNHVRLTTTKGEILFELVDDAPVSTANFLQYVEDGFYDGTIFHRIVPDFVVQGGGFLPGMVAPEGLRDPIVNEFSATRSNLRGTVAMAKLGGDPDSATSQFFVNLKDNSSNLDNQNGGFTVFARVTEGLDVVDAIAAVELDGEKPVVDVVVTRAERE